MTKERSTPQQARARELKQKIREASIHVLEAEGIDKFSTAAVSKHLNISIGSIYRYYPNKQALLESLAQEWLGESKAVFKEIESWPLEEMTNSAFMTAFLSRIAAVYRSHSKLSLLLQSILESPKLREIEAKHDEYMIRRQALILKRLSIGNSDSERHRLSEILLTQGHYGLILSLNQGPRRGAKSLTDIIFMMTQLLETYSAKPK
ncbi:TetR/AcrR family transcriptional regulator [Aestuariicella sp. G3-2]|uniref:TetR/AcrR family transcriptional regulator n=1 Tax=Pseudomaricurvus albidus TaxID=2842452 RepID=UPI001C0E3344|nr:TetR/AcrR family transcriptional regulator [Aestuariicella albida]MBU3069385.1 TetR/AcrR family transcriptional regulator [Aestuariicella albida]